MRRRVVTRYLELLEPGQLRPTRHAFVKAQVARAHIPCAELHEYLYTSIGRPWYWIDRLGWTSRDWSRHLRRADIATWIVYVEGRPAGYFELEKDDDRSVEIAYLGLMPDFIGCGIGGYVITEAVKRAWNMDASRVWVHTCTLDHPRALDQYRSHGFRLFHEAESYLELPEQLSHVA